jgi:hypothetical protein
MLSFITSSRPKEQRENVRSNLTRAIADAKKDDALLERFDALEIAWTPPAKTGFEPEAS